MPWAVIVVSPFPFTLHYNQAYIYHPTTKQRAKNMTTAPHVVLHTILNVGLESLNIIDSVVAYNPTAKANIHYPIKDAYDCNPDGGLWYLPKHLRQEFLEFFVKYFSQHPETFNFSGGRCGEAIALCDLFPDKFLVIFLDPECGSPIFSDIVEQFSQLHRFSEPYHEDAHIISLLETPIDEIDEDDYLPPIFKDAIRAIHTKNIQP